ncbi:hypothetical protein JZO66_09280 [Enterococcus sp. DIV0242_7C1]|uniref:Phage tail protein n=1 Tax=Candidatus Enterococcus dunnyi TaxID=1834192 RepID=A0A200J7P8_9ENTE|nr:MULTISPECIES: hypothetical protein [unclassified Enterococcus]MBO0470739.1 hypothetical protein [Enterococcus sp. DIV0242_7C1]OUZ33188.1 hypothetical protein A5889_001897 [Enterococcus sp. 9D6_DIV0238]
MEKKVDVIAVLSAIDKGLNGSLDDVFSKLERVNQSVDKLFSSPMDSSNITANFNEVKESFSSLNTMLESFGMSNVQGIVTNFGAMAQNQIGKAAGAFDLFASKSESATNKVGSVFSKVGSSFKSIPGSILPAFDSVETKVSGFTNDVARTVSNLAPKTVLSMLSMESGVASAMDKIGLKAIDAEIFFESISEGMKNATQNVPLLTKSLGGIGSVFQKSAGVGTTALSTMVQGLSSVFGVALKLLGPAAILGVALAGFGLINNQFGEQIQGMLTMVIEKGPELITNFVKGITDKLPDLITSGAQLVASLAEAISVNLPVIMQSAINLIDALVQGVIDSLPTLIPAALMLIESLATSLLSAAPQLLLTGLDLLMALVDGILANKDQIITTVTNIIQSFTENVTSKLPEIIQKGVEILTKLAEGIASVLPKLIPVALEAITTLVGTLLEQLPTLIDAAIKIVGALCKGLWDSLPDILLAAGKLLMTFIGGIIDILPDVSTAGWKVANEIIKAVTGIDLFEIGSNIIKGLANGIAKGAKWVWEKLEAFGNGVKNFLAEKFNIHSPSRWMRDEIGAMLPAGLAIGIERNAHVIDQPMDDLASKVILPSLDSLDQQVDTVQQLSIHSSSTQTQQKEKQPATFNINFGNQQFKAFVSDISEAMGQDAAINLAF